jgi:diguanylate cyclase (GGDEF)-like protein
MEFKSDITTRVATGSNRVVKREPLRSRPCLIQYTGDALGRRYFLDTPEVTIGRLPTNSIVISDPGVSRTHARCFVAGDVIALEDLGSRNGTFINDRRIQVRTPLRDGDILRIGGVLLKFFAQDNFENAFHDKIYRMATIDGGTDLFNKSYLLETLESEFKFSRAKGRPLSLIYYDLDFFKKVNDEHGHSCGDYILRESSQVAKSCVRKEDVIGRYGGEEFVVVLPVADTPIAAELAERIRKTIAGHPFLFNGTPLCQTVSLGVAEIRPEYKTYQELLDDADRKLYISKNAGRNRITA